MLDVIVVNKNVTGFCLSKTQEEKTVYSYDILVNRLEHHKANKQKKQKRYEAPIIA